MASPTGGQFVFSKGGQAVHLGLSQNGSAPTAVNAGTDFNIEVFVNPAGTTLPTLATGFDAGVIVTDSVNGVALTGTTNQELLGGQQLTLFGGNYQVNDDATDTVMSVHKAVTIQTGSGNQTVVDATGDTIFGGSGSLVLNTPTVPSGQPSQSGKESIIGGSGPATITGSVGDTIIAGSNNTAIDGTAGGMRITLGTGGTDVVNGSTKRATGVGADTILGGGAAAVNIQGLGTGDIVNLASQSGLFSVNAKIGGVSATLGGGDGSFFGGVGDQLQMGSGNQYVDATSGGMAVAIGSGGSESVQGSSSAVAGAGADTFTGGAASVNFQGLGKGDKLNLIAQTGTAAINAQIGNVAVTLGGGAASVYGGAGDTVVFGSVGQYFDDTAGGATLTLGSGGTDTVYGSAKAGSFDTVNVGNGAANLLYNASSVVGGDVLNLAGQTGTATINDTIGGMSVTLGGGAASMYGGAGSNVTFGSGNQYFDDSAGGATITLGSKGNDTVYGSGKAGAADTIVAGQGSAANLLYNPGSTLGGGEIINLAQSSGNNVIQAFQVGGTDFASKDTITAGTGNDSVFAGGGSRVGVGTSTQAGGSHVWFDSDTKTGPVAFGTNDTVAGEKYGAAPGAVTATGAAGSSTATVTVGGFNTASDTIFYASRSTTNLDSSIIATAQSTATSTTIVLPDGTTMILAGVTSAAGLKFTS